MTRKPEKEIFRNDGYSDKYTTKIFQETAHEDNPYCESSVHCQGFDQLELIEHLSFSEYLFLIIRGHLPSDSESQLLNRALIAFSNPGVRHPATRAAVASGVGKTLSPNILPAALLVFGGEVDASGAIEPIMRFLRKVIKLSTSEALKIPDLEIVGFGLHYGSEHRYLDQGCNTLIADNDTPYLQWGRQFVSESRAQGRVIGWSQTGLAAAVFCDLGIMPRFGASLYQLMASSGLLVQGLESTNLPPTTLPFVRDEDYQID